MKRLLWVSRRVSPWKSWGLYLVSLRWFKLLWAVCARGPQAVINGVCHCWFRPLILGYFGTLFHPDEQMLMREKQVKSGHDIRRARRMLQCIQEPPARKHREHLVVPQADSLDRSEPARPSRGFTVIQRDKYTIQQSLCHAEDQSSQNHVL